MSKIFFAAGILLWTAGCGKNEPGTMGGESATPRTVATGAPAEAARGSEVSKANRSAIESEHAMSTFDDSSRTNVRESTLPQASTVTPSTPPPVPQNRPKP